MGSYAVLRIDGYDVLSTKSAVDPSVMTIFTEDDRRVRTPGSHERRMTAGPWVSPAAAPDDPDRPWLDHAYVATALVTRERLEVMGFTLARARETYELVRAARLSDLYEAEKHTEKGQDFFGRGQLSVLSSLGFDEWVAAFRSVKVQNVHAVWTGGEQDVPTGLTNYYLNAAEATPDIRFILEDEDSLLGFAALDVRYFLRAALETCSDAALVEQDVSALVGGGYYARDEQIAEGCRSILTADYRCSAPVVVLTEESIDQHLLERALRLLYPHLAPYFSFMDFAAMAVPGGAGALVASVKAFAGAGIANRIIALFDNDTAGRDALRSLKGVALPSNFRVMTYPPITAASAWPTIGPAGLSTMDVNGLAGGIELYFGDDVLRRDDGTRVPVQWRGLIAAMGEYQGELLDKSKLQERFRRKLELAARDAALLESLDWSGVRAILDQIRRAFNGA